MSDIDEFYRQQQPPEEDCFLCENEQLAAEAQAGLDKGYGQRLVLQYLRTKGFPWRSRDKMMEHFREHVDNAF